MTINQVKKIGELIEKLKLDIEIAHRGSKFNIILEKTFMTFNNDIMDIISGKHKDS